MKFSAYLRRISILILSLSVMTAYSQLYLSGDDPASIKWQQINTENFQVVFPLGFEKQAQYFANALEKAYEYGKTTLKSSPRKISVLLHTQTAISNGSTGWAPARIDMHTTPPQDSYATDWFDQLAVHEFRHVVQIERMNTGLTKILGILLGQQAAVGVTGAYLPWWFIEGDAVVTETALSQSGRGRLPSFEMPVRAQLLEKGIYDYEKATHGSYKDFTPSAYHLGYQIVAYGRSKYGTDLWDKALENAARKPLFFTSFSDGIKKTTGLTKRQFYQESMNFLKEKWNRIYDETPTSNFKPITAKPKDFTSYINPVYLPEKEYVAFKTSIDDLTKIVKIDQRGEEKVLLTVGPGYLESLSLGKNLLCWSEIEPDIRWANRNYSVIKLYNLDTKKRSNLTHKSRCFSPQINRTGTQVAVIEVTTENKYRLVILNVLDGREMYSYEPVDQAFLMHPSWSADGTEIVMTVLNENGKNIRILNLENNQTHDILKFSYSEISWPQLVDGRVFFMADYSGIDNFYAYDRKSGEIDQLTSVKFGVGNYSFSSQSNQILFSNYTSDGFELAVQTVNRETEIPFPQIRINRFSFAEDMARQEKGLAEVDKDNLETYPVTKYRKANKLFNFHSWTPLSIDLNTYETKPGIMFMSQNLLSTAITTVGYEYDLDEQLGKYYANFQYRGWYPVIDLSVEYGQDRGLYRYTDTLDQQHEILFNYHLLETSLGVSQPLRLSKNKFISGITPFIRLNYYYQEVDKRDDLKFTEPTYQSLEYGFSVYHYLRSSLRDLYPKWGIIGRARFIHTPFTSLDKSNMFVLETILYTPGFMKHHGIRFYGAMQLRKVGTYNPSNVVSFIRGLSDPGVHDLYRFSADYKFPLFYPDWDLSSIVYLKRLTMTLFYDYVYGTAPGFKNYYYSLGTELQAQTHILSFMAPVNVGFRAVYLPELNDYVFNAFFNIDFSVLY